VNDKKQRLRELVAEWRAQANTVQNAKVSPEIKAVVVDLLMKHAKQVQACL
jgi:hypothetical protein